MITAVLGGGNGAEGGMGAEMRAGLRVELGGGG